MHRACTLGMLLLFTTVSAEWARGAPPPAPADAAADPLPAGAVARIGGARWRLLGEPRQMVVSADGSVLAVVGADFQIELLDTRIGKRFAQLGTGVGAIGQAFGLNPPLALSPDGRRIAGSDTQGFDPTVSVWDRRGKALASGIIIERAADELKLPEGVRNGFTEGWRNVTALALSPDGKAVAGAARYYERAGSGGKVLDERDRNYVRLWTLPEGQQRLELTGHRKEITALLFSTDGKTLTSASEDGTVRVWDATTGAERQVWRSHDPVFSAAYSPDGKWLACGSRKAVLLRDAATGKVRHRLGVPADAVRSVAFSRDGTRLAAAGAKALRLWDPRTGALVGDTRPAPTASRAVAFSADGQILFSGHEGETVLRRWHAATRQPVAEIAGHAAPVTVLAFTPDGRHLRSSTLAGDERAWEAATGRRCPRLEGNGQTFEADWLASVGRHALLRCEDATIGVFRLFLTGGKGAHLEDVPGFFGSSADGTRMLFQQERAGKPVLVVTDRRPGRPLREIKWDRPGEVSGALSPDGRTVAATGGDAVVLVDVATGRERQVEAPTQPRGLFVAASAGVKFSPDGSRVVVIGNKGRLRLIATADGRLLGEVVDSAIENITAVAFTPDGRTLATGGFNTPLAIREVATGQLVRTVPPGILLFSPDNRRLAIMGEDGFAVRDLYAGTLIRKFRLDAEYPQQFIFSPNGRLLASSMPDGSILVWDATSPQASAPTPPGGRNLAPLWQALRDGDARAAYPAIGALAADPARAVPFLAGRLQATPPLDGDRLRRLVATLDGPDFRQREAATAELVRLGRLAEEPVRAALAKTRSLEVRKRAAKLVQELEASRMRLTPEERAHVRAIQALERIGSPAARDVLRRLAAGAAGAPRTVEAREALRKLEPEPAQGGK